MTMNVVHLRAWGVALAVLLGSQAAYGQACVFGACTAMTNEFRTMELRPQTIALLPPQANLKKKKMLMAEDMVAESEPLEESLAAALAKRLGELGYDVKIITRADVEADPVLADLLLTANQRYDEEREKIIVKFREVNYRRYTAGDTARLLADHLDVDAVGYARMEAVGATGAAQAFSPTGGGQIRMDLAIAHARTGDIEAFFGITDTGGMFGKSLDGILKKPDKHTAKVTKKATKNFPKADKVLTAQKLDASKVRTAELTEESDAEQVLSELEGLLEQGGGSKEPAPAER